MPTYAASPTPYPDVNITLDILFAQVSTTLGEQFAGLYLYGSLSSGDFNPKTSDIDFLVVTRETLSEDEIHALEGIHVRLWASGSKWASKLEGSYVPQGALWRYDPAAGPFPTVNEGRFFVAGHGIDWIIQRHIIREHGVSIYGPDPRTLIAPVNADDLRRSVRGTLGSYWRRMSTDPSPRFHDAEYQAFAVLTMCRALYTLESGEVVSKLAAARWAQAALGESWADLIAWALAWEPGLPPVGIDAALALVRFTLEVSDRGADSAANL